jgi:geranylgeranyl pyrophosphate synthase
VSVAPTSRPPAGATAQPRKQEADEPEDHSSAEVSAALGFDSALAVLRDKLGQWLQSCDPELRTPLQWQFQGGSKYFRPLTVFSCFRAQSRAHVIPKEIANGAQAVEILHNMSLAIDDILDHSDTRRGRATLHRRYGQLPSLMASGYMMAEAYRAVIHDPQALELLCELTTRLASAECLQWRLRRQALGVETWRAIAGEDTGSMFEVCACLGDRSGALRRFGHLLGLLYHGCDDVADVRGTSALGGGGEDDLRDGILTLPAAIAILDAPIARLFSQPEKQDMPALMNAFKGALPAAETYLDQIAHDAKTEAQLFAADPSPLIALVEQTRTLSRI